mgnify:CR=1 FL=1
MEWYHSDPNISQPSCNLREKFPVGDKTFQDHIDINHVDAPLPVAQTWFRLFETRNWVSLLENGGWGLNTTMGQPWQGWIGIQTLCSHKFLWKPFFSGWVFSRPTSNIPPISPIFPCLTKYPFCWTNKDSEIIKLPPVSKNIEYQDRKIGWNLKLNLLFDGSIHSAGQIKARDHKTASSNQEHWISG